MSQVFGESFLWLYWGHLAYCNGLWPLCGHLQVPALYNLHETASM
jgi:hypothetical protein